jgi:hypothetical protein
MSNEEWEADVRRRLPAALINEVRRVLEQRRNLSEPRISYSALHNNLAILRLVGVNNSITYKRIDDALGVVSLESDRAGRGMLSVLVVRKDGAEPAEPSDGFYDMARSMGRTGDNAEILVREFNLVTRFRPAEGQLLSDRCECSRFVRTGV